MSIILLAILYFVPSLIAFSRGHNSRWAIFLTNVLFGWTLVVWVITLIWSLTGNTGGNPTNTIIIQNNVTSSSEAS